MVYIVGKQHFSNNHLLFLNWVVCSKFWNACLGWERNFLLFLYKSLQVLFLNNVFKLSLFFLFI